MAAECCQRQLFTNGSLISGKASLHFRVIFKYSVSSTLGMSLIVFIYLFVVI